MNANAFALTFAFAPSHTSNASKVKRECKPTHPTVQTFVQTLTDIARNVNRFYKVCADFGVNRFVEKAAQPLTESLAKILKKGGLVVNQTVVLLMKCVQAKKNATEESGKNLYLFVAFFLTNSIASNPPFLKLRQAVMRYTQPFRSEQTVVLI